MMYRKSVYNGYLFDYVNDADMRVITILLHLIDLGVQSLICHI